MRSGHEYAQRATVFWCKKESVWHIPRTCSAILGCALSICCAARGLTGELCPKRKGISVEFMNGSGNCNTTNKALISWVEQQAKLCTPDRVYWVDGSEEENKALCDLMVKSGTLTRLDEKKRPGSYLA